MRVRFVVIWLAIIVAGCSLNLVGHKDNFEYLNKKDVTYKSIRKALKSTKTQIKILDSQKRAKGKISKDSPSLEFGRGKFLFSKGLLKTSARYITTRGYSLDGGGGKTNFLLPFLIVMTRKGKVIAPKLIGIRFRNYSGFSEPEMTYDIHWDLGKTINKAYLLILSGLSEGYYPIGKSVQTNFTGMDIPVNHFNAPYGEFEVRVNNKKFSIK